MQISITIPEDLIAELYRRAPLADTHTAIVAEALRYFFSTHTTVYNELEIINRYADELNQETKEVLDYQVIS